MTLARILIVDEKEAMPLLQNALRPYDLVVAYNMKDAMRAVREDGFDLFVIGVHFDDSRALELCGDIRKVEQHKATPIIVVRVLKSSNPQILRQTLDTAIKVGAIDEYVELDGSPDAENTLVKMVEKWLPFVKRAKSSELERR